MNDSWNPPETAPTNGNAIRVIVGDGALDEFTVRWAGNGWFKIGSYQLVSVIQGWLPVATVGGLNDDSPPVRGVSMFQDRDSWATY